jgi:hypothetical protein
MNQNHPMMNRLSSGKRLFFLSILAGCSGILVPARAQQPQQTPATVVAGGEYKASPRKVFWLGKHYRKEWVTPVPVSILNLDTLGGLTPIEQGGGRQTKTLRLKDGRGREYVLRSVNKEYGKALPPGMQGTFIEKLAKDQVSTAHPYAAITVPSMAKAAGIYHTTPKILLVPYSDRLGMYNRDFANTLCLFEERPNGDQSSNPNFGNSRNVTGTEKVMERLLRSSHNQVDQVMYIRSRLFDMFLGDWGRHDDQWRWASFAQGSDTLWRAIPRDRDQTYTLFDGFLPKLVTSAEALEHVNSFHGKIKNIKKYNFPARYIDRRFTTALTKEQWMAEAKALQAALTDEVIENGIRQMPAEVFPISGPAIIDKLKKRRNDLLAYAEKYYSYVNEDVEIVGSEADEYFEVTRIDNRNVSVTGYTIDASGKQAAAPFFTRVFDRGETDEIRIYGIGGKDQYALKGTARKGIKVRIIGGTGNDQLLTEKGTGHRMKVYDTDISTTQVTTGHLPGNDKELKKQDAVKLKFANDTAIHRYQYTAFHENVGSTVKAPSYSNVRGIYLNFGYKYKKYAWRKEPYSWFQSLRGNYSITNKSFGADYDADFHFGKWSVVLDGSYDQRLRHFFYGIGNETKQVVEDREYYRLYTSEGKGSAGLSRQVGRHHHFTVSGLYQSIKVLRDSGHYAGTLIPATKEELLHRKNFAGAGFSYTMEHINSLTIPTRGLSLLASVQQWEPMERSSNSFTRFTGVATGYVPLSRAFSLALKIGGTHLEGDPEFYQYGVLGGNQSLRGYRRERFYGKSTFYNTNELRWIPQQESGAFSGHLGLVAFYDQARVWQPGEDSNKLHAGYGGGIIGVLFKKFAVTAAYGFSEEGRVLHLRVGNFF